MRCALLRSKLFEKSFLRTFSREGSERGSGRRPEVFPLLYKVAPSAWSGGGSFVLCKEVRTAVEVLLVVENGWVAGCQYISSVKMLDGKENGGICFFHDVCY